MYSHMNANTDSIGTSVLLLREQFSTHAQVRSTKPYDIEFI